MLQNIKLNNILFLDIETVPKEKEWKNLSDKEKELWENKSKYKRIVDTVNKKKYQNEDEVSPEEFYEEAGIWAEFGKIVCISVGYFKAVDNTKSGNREFRIKSFYGEEKELLQSFVGLIEKHFNENVHFLCAHNGKEFDFPYIARRMLIHQIPIPEKLNTSGKKPWEVTHLDTLELWKFGDKKNFTSLDLITHLLGIPSPKKDIDGSQVKDIFYSNEKNRIERIVSYCQNDVLSVAQVILRFLYLPLLTEEEIEFVKVIDV